MHPSLPSVSKDEGLRDVGHSMTIGNLILGVNSIPVSYLIHHDSLIQNATAIYYKMRQVFYYKMWQFYCKMWQLLQIATILLQNATVITNPCSVAFLMAPGIKGLKPYNNVIGYFFVKKNCYKKKYKIYAKKKKQKNDSY